MSKITLAPNASGTGILTVAAPNTNSNYTLTLPAETGTVLTSVSTVIQNGGPAFRAKMSGTQALSLNTWTKLQFSNEEFDTNSCYDPTTNYRFTPTTAGYYQVTMSIKPQYANSTSALVPGLYKNGTLYAYSAGATGSSSFWVAQLVTTLIYFNGSTDYVEAYAYSDSSAITTYNDNSVYFCGALVRAA